MTTVLLVITLLAATIALIASRQGSKRPVRPPTPAQLQQVRSVLEGQGEVAAIRRYRELTGANLVQAVQEVRALSS